MTDKLQKRILIIGAAGSFGSHLCRALAKYKEYTLILAGRDQTRLDILSSSLTALYCETLILDRNDINVEDLESAKCDLVIDMAGPFQASTSRVIEASIKAKCHYIDIADSRDFVMNIAKYNGDAHKADIMILSGASTTPSLTHAIIDELCYGWQRIDTIRVAICPANKGAIGLSVTKAILSWVGNPIPQWTMGQWLESPAWSQNRKINIPNIGKRRVALADTPDTTLLQERYQARVEANIMAGLEVGILHNGLTVSSWLVQLGWLKSLLPFANIYHRIAAWLSFLGTDKGGMEIEVKGLDADNNPVISTWSLSAKDGKGPEVPTIPARLLALKILNSELEFSGAATAIGILNRYEIEAALEEIGIETQLQTHPLGTPIFEKVLNRKFARLPDVTKAIHRPEPVLLLKGKADIEASKNILGKFIANIFNFPKSGRDIPLTVTIERTKDGKEIWTRRFGEDEMSSVIRAAEEEYSITENFGSFACTMALEASKDGLKMIATKARLFGIPLPKFFIKDITATETAKGNEHHFDVTITLPIIGQLVQYRGFVEIV